MAAVQVGPIEGVAILGGGTAFPPRVRTNLDVLRDAPATGRARGRADDDELRFMADGIEETIGLSERAWTHDVGQPLAPDREENTVDLAVRAARAALADAKLDASDLALIVCATSTPHRMSSTVAGAVGAALGAHAACMDTRAGCAGALFGLTTAALYLGAGAGPALVIGTETFSKVIPPAHRLARLSLGDGAGALVIGRREGARLVSAFLETDGALGHLITTDGSLPPTPEEIARGGYWLTGSPTELAEVVPSRYEAALRGALSRAGCGPAEIDLFVPHQTSRALVLELCRRLELPESRTFVNVHRHANIGSAGWIAALVEARAEGRCPPGTRLAVAAVGGGLSWAAAVLQC